MSARGTELGLFLVDMYILDLELDMGEVLVVNLVGMVCTVTMLVFLQDI